MSVLGTVALALTVLLLLLVVLLAAPVTVWVDLHRRERLRGQARIRALFGLVKAELPGPPGAKKKKPPPPRRRRPGLALAALRSPGLLSAALLCLERLLRAVRVRDLDGLLCLGLDDPADTGLVWGVLGPAVFLGGRRFPGLRAVPSFEGERLHVDATGTAVVVPLEVLLIALAFLLTPATLRALVAGRRAR